jgi:hypothetical protein
VFVEFLVDRAYLTLVDPNDDTSFGPYVVSAGEVFVLGDHRAGSLDSRAWTDRYGRPGRGVPLRFINGRGDWFLARTHGNGSADFSGAFGPLRVDAEVDGIDTTKLRAGVAQCLAKRPGETLPPAQTKTAGITRSGALP